MKDFITLVIIASVIYLLGAFIGMDLNVVNWTPFGRFLYVMFTVMITGAMTSND